MLDVQEDNGAILKTQNHILHVVPDTYYLYVSRYLFCVLCDQTILKTQSTKCVLTNSYSRMDP
jgi:hypothetical protein